MNYSKIKKKLVPVPDGSPELHLQTATVSAIASDGTVDILLNGATVPDVPVLGSARFVSGSVVQVLTYRGSTLVIGGSGRMISQTVAASGSITAATLANGGTSYSNSLSTSGTALHGIAFVAPPSGKVLVTGRAVASNNTAGGFALLDFEIRVGAVVGSGSVFRAANNATAGAQQSDSANQQSSVMTGDLIVGLTPGTVYNATLAYAAGAGSQTISYNRRHISVQPS